MAHTIATILGISDDQVTQATYLSVDKKKDKTDALGSTAAGHMIFDYDPTGGNRREPRAWRIIWQNSLILGQQWK